MRKKINPSQLDLIHLLHYQHAPEFSGPQLPADHPAYRAVIAKPRPSLPLQLFRFAHLSELKGVAFSIRFIPTRRTLH